MDYNPSGSSVHEIFQARILEWVAIFFPTVIFPTQRSNPGFLHWQADSLPLSHQGSPVSSTMGCNNAKFSTPPPYSTCLPYGDVSHKGPQNSQTVPHNSVYISNSEDGKVNTTVQVPGSVMLHLRICVLFKQLDSVIQSQNIS